MASPTYFRLAAEFRGRAAHAGIRPEDGRSAILAAAHAIAAMPHGRLDPQTTANVGYVHAGVPAATNVVPEHCSLLAEARSLDAERVEEVVSAMVDAVHDGAAAHECDVDLVVEKLFGGYRTRPSAPAVTAAESALRACGYEPSRITTGGGSDANAFAAQGFECVNLANGTERNHQPDERVSVAALEGMFDVTLALLDAAAEA
jgi:tripeptide aminopeptidase